MRRTGIFILITTLAIIALAYFKGDEVSYEVGRKLNIFSAGSYPFAQCYEINTSESQLQNAIIQFKELNPRYRAEHLKDDIPGGDSLIYKTIYFSTGQEGNIIHAYFTSIGPNKTRIGFTGLSSTNGFGNWKNINEDFDFYENKKLLRNFEHRILKPIVLLVQK